MKLAALKWFRICIGLQDEFHNRQLIQHALFEPILNIVYETMPRDNLLNSACLDLFEYIRRENPKQLVTHLVELYRARLLGITYVNTFEGIVTKYDQMKAGYNSNGTEDSVTTLEGTPQRNINGGRLSGLREVDADEEAYFNADDDLEADDDDEGLPTTAKVNMPNGASPMRSLVSYPDDEDEAMDILASSPDPLKEKKSSSSDPTSNEGADADEETIEEPERGRDRKPVQIDGSPGRHSPPESILKKRTREDEDDDELGKLMAGGIKRRNSSASVSSRLGDASLDEAPHQNGHHVVGSLDLTNGHPHGQTLRRKGSLKTKNESHKLALKPVNITLVDSGTEGDEENHNAGGGDG